MAAEKVKERLRRAVAALAKAGIPYAVVGGNAVAEWVARKDEEAVRTTRDVDLLLNRCDFAAARASLEAAGFIYQQLLDVDTFIDGLHGKPSGGVHVLFAGEKVHPEDAQASPGLAESEQSPEFTVVSLDALVRMKLISWRRKDQVHLLDMIAVGLIDATWPSRLAPPLGERLQQLLDDPNG